MNIRIRIIFAVAPLVLALSAIQGFAQSTYEPYTFTTLAGGGGSNSPDVPGTAARSNTVNGVALDNAGNLYVVDTFNHAIRKIAPNGLITTLAGSPGNSGSADGTGIDARFNIPAKAAVDGSGNVYVTDDQNSTIRKITPQGVVTTLAGLAGHPGSANGTNSVARFNTPDGVAVDGAGNVYVADGANSTIRKLSPVGTNWVVTTIAGLAGSTGSLDGTNRAARFRFPSALAIDGAGNLYVADTDNFTVRKVTPIGTNWVVTTIAGRAGFFGSVDGTNSAARFNGFVGLAVDAAGTVYVADTDNHTIRKVTPVGTNWVVTTLAGVGGNYGSTDGPGNVALFKGPAAVAVDSAGNTYVADQINHTIRKLTPAGEVTTLAGLAGYSGSQNAMGTVARFNNPLGVAVDAAGNVYVSDWLNVVIRKVAPGGVVTTLAGLAGAGGSEDGIGSAARFAGPSGVAVDGAGNVYVATTRTTTSGE